MARETTPDGKFWKIHGDPSLNFVRPFLSWIRKEYEELSQVIRENGRGRIFILLGTEGCGKSQFAVQFALDAAHGRRILFKKNADVFIVDGEQGSSEGPFAMSSPEIEDLLDDEESWLIIDGKQEKPVACRCKVLVACSTRKSNLSKLHGAVQLYLSAWSREEVCQFLDDFEAHRQEYDESMEVPSKERALEVFESLGGAARDVLHSPRGAVGLNRWRTAIDDLGRDVNAGIVLAASFLEDVSDRVVHMFATKDHTWFSREFASDATITRLHRAYLKGGRPHTAAFLERTVSVSVVGTLWGKLYESVALERFSAPSRLRSKLSQVDTDRFLDVGPREIKTFRSLQELRDLLASDKQGTVFCYPVDECLESVDAAMRWNNKVVLLQFFKRKTGQDGLKVKGLENIDDVLEMKSYEVWACVPAEYYGRTGPQSYRTVNNKKFRGSSKVIPKITQRVVELDYRWVTKATEQDSGRTKKKCQAAVQEAAVQDFDSSSTTKKRQAAEQDFDSGSTKKKRQAAEQDFGSGSKKQKRQATEQHLDSGSKKKKRQAGLRLRQHK